MDKFWQQLIQRLIRAAKLDHNLYDEVKQDTKALPQAMIVVLVSSFAAGIGSVSKIGTVGIFAGTLVGLIGWYILAMLTYFIGTRILPEPQAKSDIGQLLRTIGFSTAPGIIRFLGVISGLERLIFSFSAAWMLVAMVIAVKSAFGYKNYWRAIAICVIVQVILILFVILLSGGGFKPG